MDVTLNDKGQLVDADGQVVSIDGEPLTVKNARTQDQIDDVVKERLGREKRKIDDLQKQIETLRAQAEKTPALEEMIRNLEASKRQSEEAVAAADAKAREEVSRQLQTLQRKAADLEEALSTERTGRIRDQVRGVLLAHARDRFIDPDADVVPKLMAAHKREPAIGEDGKPIDGQTRDLFQVPIVEGDGKDAKERLEWLPADKALDAFAANPKFRHYVRATNAGGSGGSTALSASHASLRRSQMSEAEKAEFAGKHGVDAFKALQP